jgi:hypothetical protein
MSHKSSKYRQGLFAVLSICLSLTGCGESGPPRAPIQGSVTIGGAPLKAGRILFVPQAPSEGPAVSARITDGQYTLDDSTGPVVGSNRVEVEADLPLKFAIDDEAAFAKAKGKLPRQPVPPQFNRQSTLSVTVKADESNQFNVAIPATIPISRSASR